MPNFRYRALTQSGELVSGLISAPTVAEVTHRIDYLRLIPVDAIVEEERAPSQGLTGGRARAEDVTNFTLDLSLLLTAGVRLEEALALLANDTDVRRLRPIVSKIRTKVLSGESFADALGGYPATFPQIYVALVRIGEASGKLNHMLSLLACERERAEIVKRKLADALRYPSFVFLAAIGVLGFFLLFVLPQFSTVLRDFGAKIDPLAGAFLSLSEAVSTHVDVVAGGAALLLGGGVFIARSPKLKAGLLGTLARLPLIRTITGFYRTSYFCRNIGVLLGAAVPLPTSLRILADMMSATGGQGNWLRITERVRQGGKLSDALSEFDALPSMAIRMLRLGEETGQLPVIAARIADFYESKLQRSLDRIVGLVGPAAIVSISLIVGGLIVSVMTSLLSVSQVVG